MVLRFGQSKAEDVATLIAKKNYSRAIEVVRAQLQTQKADSRLRLQLGDVLALAGRNKEAVQVLAPLADEFAREGFAAKAVAILKKMQKLEPGRRDVDAKLAELIEQKQRQATVVLPLVPPPGRAGLEIGIEEIGFEPSPEPVDSRPALGLAEAEPVAEVNAPELDLAWPGAAVPVLAPTPVERPSATPPPTSGRAIPVVLDQDLFTEDPDLMVLEASEPPLEESAPASEDIGPDAMSEGLFASELMQLVEGAFAGLPGGADGVPMPDHDVGTPSSNQIVVSPLFRDFSVDEMVAVIQGLELLSFEPRQVILREGAPGDALYMLTAGTVKAYVKGADGKQVLVGELREGAFFGEGSILTGRPRSATVVAATHCELLELDRKKLNDITAHHPHVRDVLEEFARERATRRA
jgi:hypothetical protein